jgi:hypothetical protein
MIISEQKYASNQMEREEMKTRNDWRFTLVGGVNSQIWNLLLQTPW